MNHNLILKFSSISLLTLHLLCIHGLAGGNGYHVVDVFYGAAAGEVVYRTSDTLEDGADGDGVAQALDEFIGDVTHFEAGEYQHIGVTGNVAAGSLLLAHRGNKGGIGLQFAVDLQ